LHKARADFISGPIWPKLIRELAEFNDQYLGLTGYPLLMTGPSPEIQIKPFDSFILKTFRKNIIQNKCWLIPTNCFSQVNDLLRTLLVVKYLDGVHFLIENIQGFCKARGTECRMSFEAREDGYYAGHTYVRQAFEIPKLTWDTETIEMSVEIQITTQLQETIRRLLHKHYEKRRVTSRKEKEHWQWDYKSDEFAANYLGHILHYVEGMIMEVREKQKGKI
jgi:hypothetical protein